MILEKLLSILYVKSEFVTTLMKRLYLLSFCIFAGKMMYA